MSAMIAVTVNGNLAQAESGATLAQFLAAHGLDPRKVAVERNRALVPRSLFGETVLAPGDALEIVQFVGGG
jgi:thiamine biosynthesis protein ThiS